MPLSCPTNNSAREQFWIHFFDHKSLDIAKSKLSENELPKYMAFYWFLSLHYNPIKCCYPPDLLEIYLRNLSQIYIL